MDTAAEIQLYRQVVNPLIPDMLILAHGKLQIQHFAVINYSYVIGPRHGHIFKNIIGNNMSHAFYENLVNNDSRILALRHT